MTTSNPTSRRAWLTVRARGIVEIPLSVRLFKD